MDYPTDLFEAAINEKVDLPNGMYYADWVGYRLRLVLISMDKVLSFTTDKGMTTIIPQSRNVIVKDNVGYIYRQEAKMSQLFKWMGDAEF